MLVPKYVTNKQKFPRTNIQLGNIRIEESVLDLTTKHLTREKNDNQTNK